MSQQQEYFAARFHKLPKWARDYVHLVETFIGAEEIKELVFLRDQNAALIKTVGELKRQVARLERKARG